MLHDCQRCAARTSQASEYLWWLRLATKRCDVAIERAVEGGPDDDVSLLVPDGFAARIFKALQWPGVRVQVAYDQEAPTDMTRLALRYNPEEAA